LKQNGFKLETRPILRFWTDRFVSGPGTKLSTEQKPPVEFTASHTIETNPAEQKAAVVVIGASAGGVSALSTLVSQLPSTFPAPILIVLHIGSHHSVLPQILSSRGPLPAAHAQHGERMMAGCIYVAPPDRHLLVEDGQLRLTRGPKEHFTRPAIDPLFLSAALAYGPRAVGVILTGTMDDGTAGLQAIKACGGMAVVQDPDDAQEPSMPRSALRHVAVDHCGPIDGMADALTALASRDYVRVWAEKPAQLLHEQALALAQGDPMDHLVAIANPSTFVCPDCSGSLWQLRDATPLRFRCHTGHAFTLRTLQHALKETADEALWTAVRALQEQALLLGALAAAHQEAGEEQELDRIEQGRQALMKQTNSLRAIIEREPETF
jgi:two-component system chemotaxis response regulator CheB